MATETDIVVEPSESSPGNWYWAFLIDGETHSDGEAATEAEARRKARTARSEWEDRDR